MQETVSGYKFRIFHHCPGGRVWGGQAVVELAAWGFGHPSPVNGSWKTGAHFHAKGWGLPQGALALVLRWHEDNPAQRPEQGTPQTPGGFRPWDTTEAAEVSDGGSKKHSRQAG